MSNQRMSDTTEIEKRIEGKIDPDRVGLTQVSTTTGGLVLQDGAQVMEFSKLMAVSGQAVPKHLRGQPGACLAVCVQAMEWKMSPFAVANKSYAVNDRIAYEAQLIQAVIEQRAPIKGRIKGSYEGEGSDRVCVLTVVSAEDGETITYRSPKIKDIPTKNSPLWRGEPDQQLWYYSTRAMARRHFPDVLLGVYERSEIEDAPAMKDVTRKEATGGWADKARAARRPEPEPEPERQDNVGNSDAIDAEDAEIPDAEVIPEFDEDEVDAMTDEYDEGVTAANQDAPERDCPHEPGTQEWTNWIGGHRFCTAQKEVE